MPQFEKTYQDAIDTGHLPGMVAQAVSKDGAFNYSKSMGLRSLNQGNQKPIDEDTICWLASCTKLMVAISALQCVERGLVDLDADVTTVLPEYGQHGVIVGWDEDKNEAVIKPLTRKGTLRHLLTHASGVVYEEADPLVMRWRAKQDASKRLTTFSEKYSIPLVFEPGTAWSYGASIDLAGKVIERATGQNLEEYMKQHIWGPLGIKDITFFPAKRADMADRMADRGSLGPDGKAVASEQDDGVQLPDECLGGHGTYGSSRDYFKLIQAVFRKDPVLLKPESYTELFRPQLSEESRAAFLYKLRNDPIWSIYVKHNIPPEVGRDFTFAGMITTDDQKGYFSKNTVTWSGAACMIWWMDFNNGICGLATAQMFPPVNPPIMGLHEQFQRGIYSVFEDFRNQK